MVPDCVSKMFDIDFWGFGKNKKAVILWRCAFLALFWIIWFERNGRIFEDKEFSLSYLWDRVHFLASFWAHSSKDMGDIPLFLLKSDWRAVLS